MFGPMPFIGNASFHSPTLSPSSTVSSLITDPDGNTDIGVTSHITFYCHWICHYHPFIILICLVDKSIIYSAGVGTVVFNLVIGGKREQSMEFSNVLHIPDLSCNLLSMLL